MNSTFTEVYNILRTRYVRKSDFMLSLYNESLVDIDPYDNELNDETKLAIINECKKNIWYFLRNVVRVPLKTIISTESNEELNNIPIEYQTKPVPYRLTYKSAAQIWCSENRLNTYRVEKEEDYETIDTSCILLWHILYDNIPIIINNKFYGGVDLFNEIVELINLLPDYMQILLTINESGIIMNDGKDILTVSDIPVTKDNTELIRRQNDGCISVYPNFEFMLINLDLLSPYNNIDDTYDIIITKPNEKITSNKEEIARFIIHSYKWNDGLYDLDNSMIRQILLTNCKSYTIYMGYTYTSGGNASEIIHLIPGPKGYTPQRGTDYWTEEDIKIINAYIDAEIIKIKTTTKESILKIKTALDDIYNTLITEDEDNNKNPDDNKEPDINPSPDTDKPNKDPDDNKDSEDKNPDDNKNPDVGEVEVTPEDDDW